MRCWRKKKQQTALTELCQTSPTETGLREIHFYAAQDSLCALSSTGEIIWELRFQTEKIAPTETSKNTYKYNFKKNTLKLFHVVELILWHMAFNERAILSQEWTASKNSNYRWLQSLCNTWNYLHSTRFRLLCDILKYRQKQDIAGAFLKQNKWTKKGSDISLRLSLSSFYVCIKKKVKIHATSLQFPHI